jgi:hypothetical protein
MDLGEALVTLTAALIGGLPAWVLLFRDRPRRRKEPKARQVPLAWSSVPVWMTDPACGSGAFADATLQALGPNAFVLSAAAHREWLARYS